MANLRSQNLQPCRFGLVVTLGTLYTVAFAARDCVRDRSENLPPAINYPFRTGYGRVLIHYHIQHHAGTSMWRTALSNGDCGMPACGQRWPAQQSECLSSLSEQYEATNILRNNHSFVSIEMMLPPQYPLPFTDPDVRKNFLFTTIMRNPMDRMLSALHNKASSGKKYPEVLMNRDYSGILGENAFSRDLSDSNHNFPIDLALRWLAGVKVLRVVTDDDLDLAKCRLDGFDIIVDFHYLDDFAKLFCNRSFWRLVTFFVSYSQQNILNSYF